MGQKNYERIPKNWAYWAARLAQRTSPLFSGARWAPENKGKTLSIHDSSAETALLRTPCKTGVDKPKLILKLFE
jgi:hypothetical protein